MDSADGRRSGRTVRDGWAITARKILAKMDETEFFHDLFEAKLKCVTTRPFRNEPQAKPKLH